MTNTTSTSSFFSGQETGTETKYYLFLGQTLMVRRRYYMRLNQSTLYDEPIFVIEGNIINESIQVEGLTPLNDCSGKAYVSWCAWEGIEPMQ